MSLRTAFCEAKQSPSPILFLRAAFCLANQYLTTMSYLRRVLFANTWSRCYPGNNLPATQGIVAEYIGRLFSSVISHPSTGRTFQACRDHSCHPCFLGVCRISGRSSRQCTLPKWERGDGLLKTSRRDYLWFLGGIAWDHK